MVTKCLYVDIEFPQAMVKEHLPLRVFGVLADLAWPVVKRFRTDLFHDARWLTMNLSTDSETVFAYGVSESGTFIGLNERETVEHSTYAYRVRVFRDRHWWQCEVKPWPYPNDRVTWTQQAYGRVIARSEYNPDGEPHWLIQPATGGDAVVIAESVLCPVSA